MLPCKVCTTFLDTACNQQPVASHIVLRLWCVLMDRPPPPPFSKPLEPCKPACVCNLRYAGVAYPAMLWC